MYCFLLLRGGLFIYIKIMIKLFFFLKHKPFLLLSIAGLLVLGFFLFSKIFSYNYLCYKNPQLNICTEPLDKTTLSENIRKKFKSQLKFLPQINYIKALGYKPSLEELELGRLLFNDTILSRNNDTSCATCHLSNHGFSDGNSLNFGALGFGGPNGDTVGKGFSQGELSTNRQCGKDGLGVECKNPMFRNSLSTINVAYRANISTDQGLLWDGRFGKLKFQVLLPIHTSAELCGTNPVPINKKNNIFSNTKLFKTPVYIQHSHLSDYIYGKNKNNFNSPPEHINSIPIFRPTGQLSIPLRNECLAIAIAKIRSVKKYKTLFKAVYKQPVSDLLLGRALASFVSTHVSKHTPYDSFIKGENSLNTSQLKGLVSFFTDINTISEVKQNKSILKIKGAGCFRCHNAPLFGGKIFSSLGVIGHSKSLLSKPKLIFDANNDFFVKVKTQKGHLPECHIQNLTTTEDYVPDIGRALSTSKLKDCFSFRVPPLRNVIESFPYFHHGTANAKNYLKNSLIKKSLFALKQVVKYHLRGPINIQKRNQTDGVQSFFDPYFQLDTLIPFDFMQFSVDAYKTSFPVNLNKKEVDNIVQFIAFGLWDTSSVKLGDLKNNVSHPKKVPSGFFPSITRDQGNQTEMPPNSDIN